MREKSVRVEHVDYNYVCGLLISSVKISGESKRLKWLVKDLGKYLNKGLDCNRIRMMLDKGGYIEERREVYRDWKDNEVLKVEEWVVV